MKSRRTKRNLARGRQWLFRLIAAVLLPLLLLAGLEGALRLAGYGYTTGFFRHVRIAGRDFLVNNETFSLQYFPPQLARWPDPIMIEARKPADTYRIFILGESAARGELEPPYSAARYMEVLLRERFPGQKFEVVNVATTAINSHVILPVARELARCQGDLWIIYMGNNEMVGPFGAVTVFGAQAPPLALVRLGLAIQQTRVGQLLMALARQTRGKAATSESWGGMKMFLGNHVRPDSPRKQAVYHSFDRNLHDILRAGLNSGARVILNTVAVNLKDCPPFVSLTNSNLPPADRSAWEKAYADGCRAATNGSPAEAVRAFEQACRLDPLVPDAQFRWAEGLLALTNYPGRDASPRRPQVPEQGRLGEASLPAREHFQLACDDDALPFRADSQVNALIRKAAREYADPRLDLYDAAAMPAGNASGIPGEELFYEHVHFNFDGNYRLGLAWAQEAERLLPPSIRSLAAGPWPTQETCEKRLGLSDWNRCAVIMTVMNRLHRPPFNAQSNNERRLAALQAQATACQRRMSRAAAAQARADFLDALRRAPDDHWLHENFAEFLESTGDLKQALAEWQQVRALLPYYCFAWFKEGQLLAQQRASAEAESALRESVALRPSLTEGWFELGNLYLDTDRPALALPAYERARQLEPREATYYAHAGKALSKLGRHPEAMDQYRQALSFQPSLAEAHFALGDEYAAASQFADAETEYAQVVQLMPTNTLARLNLGVMQARQGQFDAALAQFAAVLRLDPGSKLAREYRDRVQGWKDARTR